MGTKIRLNEYQPWNCTILHILTAKNITLKYWSPSIKGGGKLQDISVLSWNVCFSSIKNIPHLGGGVFTQVGLHRLSNGAELCKKQQERHRHNTWGRREREHRRDDMLRRSSWFNIGLLDCQERYKHQEQEEHLQKRDGDTFLKNVFTIFTWKPQCRYIFILPTDKCC